MTVITITPGCLVTLFTGLVSTYFYADTSVIIAMSRTSLVEVPGDVWRKIEDSRYWISPRKGSIFLVAATFKTPYRGSTYDSAYLVNQEACGWVFMNELDIMFEPGEATSE